MSKEPFIWLSWMFLSTILSFLLLDWVITFSFFVAGLTTAAKSLIEEQVKN
jgi:hypothetical protein